MSDTKSAAASIPTAEKPKDPHEGATFQDVPLGGQPVRKTVTYEEMQENTKTEHDACTAIWEKVIKSLERGLEECPGGRSKGAMEVRNHLHVWLTQAKSLKDAL